ncbi:MAG: HD domain-containing phosphohydrolase [Candidatus Omnitrophota bacterium]
MSKDAGKNRENKKMKKETLLWGLFFEKLLQNVDASVMVTDREEKVIFANERYLDFFSFRKEEILGKSWIETVIPKAQRELVKKIFEDIKAKKMLGKFDTPVANSKKLKKHLCWIAIPLEEERTMLYTFIGKEITESPGQKIVKVYKNTKVTLNTAYAEVVEALFSAAEVSEPGTAKHATRVMLFAGALAKKLNISQEDIEKLKVASLLHDLGKLAVDEKILFKKGKLNGEEFEQIKNHPRWGSEMIYLVYFLRDIIPIMANHHENYDGTGYPDGLEGENIPLSARVLGIADIYEALTADRPYRRGFSHEDAVEIIKSEKGRKLDPAITDVFLEMLKNGEIKENI